MKRKGFERARYLEVQRELSYMHDALVRLSVESANAHGLKTMRLWDNIESALMKVRSHLENESYARLGSEHGVMAVGGCKSLGGQGYYERELAKGSGI